MEDILNIIYFYILMFTLEGSKEQRESTVQWNPYDLLVFILYWSSINPLTPKGSPFDE